MDLGASYVVVTDDELEQLTGGGKDPLTGGDPWPLYDTYPDAEGYIELSRVGFDSSLEQALIYVSCASGPLGATGMYYVMQKGASGWKVTYERMIWIS